jgi:hypothetical protein
LFTPGFSDGKKLGDMNASAGDNNAQMLMGKPGCFAGYANSLESSRHIIKKYS